MNDLFVSGLADYNTPLEKEFIDKNYGLSENVSIDYAVMENAKNVYVLPATFDWNDLGTWGSLHEKLPKDECNNSVVNATVVLQNASNNIISTSKDKLVIIDGLEDFIIVDKDNVLLIYPKSKEQEIKGIVSQLNK
jgi:mannose-1-phosphate guanylyltransferase